MVMHRELSLLTSYTLEASFCGFLGSGTARKVAREPSDEEAKRTPADSVNGGKAVLHKLTTHTPLLPF